MNKNSLFTISKRFVQTYRIWKDIWNSHYAHACHGCQSSKSTIYITREYSKHLQESKHHKINWPLVWISFFIEKNNIVIFNVTIWLIFIFRCELQTKYRALNFLGRWEEFQPFWKYIGKYVFYLFNVFCYLSFWITEIYIQKNKILKFVKKSIFK